MATKTRTPTTVLDRLEALSGSSVRITHARQRALAERAELADDDGTIAAMRAGVKAERAAAAVEDREPDVGEEIEEIARAEQRVVELEEMADTLAIALRTVTERRTATLRDGFDELVALARDVAGERNLGELRKIAQELLAHRQQVLRAVDRAVSGLAPSPLPTGLRPSSDDHRAVQVREDQRRAHALIAQFAPWTSDAPWAAISALAQGTDAQPSSSAVEYDPDPDDGELAHVGPVGRFA